jgi:hypothetical protein
VNSIRSTNRGFCRFYETNRFNRILHLTQSLIKKSKLGTFGYKTSEVGAVLCRVSSGIIEELMFVHYIILRTRLR